MQVEEFFAPRVLIVSGKGGVGKTTVSAALALLAARNGRRVCIAEVDQKGTLPRLFGGGALGYEPAEIAPQVWGLNIKPDDALAEYLRVQYHMKRIAKVFTSTHFMDFVTTAAPGLKDILVLGKIWFLEQGRGAPGTPSFDTIIVDAPAAGHMLTFLQAPMGLSDALRVGPVRRQADWLVGLLQDPARTRVHLVTLPEEMPVSETIETTTALHERIEIAQGVVFANAVYQSEFTGAEVTRITEASGATRKLLVKQAETIDLRLDGEDLDEMLGYGRFLAARRKIQSRYLKELKTAVEAPVVELPFLFGSGLALPDIEVLVDVMSQSIEKL